MALSDFPPFLTDNDPASDFAAYTRAMVGPWYDVPLASGFAYQGSSKMRVRREGGRVFFEWGISSTGITALGVYTISTSIPAALCPPVSRYCPGVLSNNGNATGGLILWPDGRLQFRLGGATGSYYLFDGVTAAL